MRFPLSFLVVGRVAIGIGFFRVQEWAPSRKALFYPMPVGHAGLADLPAEKYHFIPDHAWEIDESLFRPLAHAAIAVNFFHPSLDLSYKPGDLLVLLQTFHKVRLIGVQPFISNDGFALAPEASNILQNTFK